jgi:membrane-associated phospholipid phosphatase
MTFTATILDLIKKNKSYFIIYLIFLIIGAPLLLMINKGDVVLWLNENHTPFWDQFFKTATFFGDGAFFGLVLIPLGFIRIKHIFYGLAVLASSGLTAQIFKRIFDMPRPLRYFGDAVALHFVEGVKVYSYNSFPSGHSATGFALCLLLTILIPNKKLGFLFGICAIIIGLSRSYLVQHFFMDVYFGSIVGVVMTLITYALFLKWKGINTAGWTTFSLLEKIRG